MIQARRTSVAGKKTLRSCPTCRTPYSTEREYCGIDGAHLESYESDPLIGTEIDRYRVVGHLGDGAMARVYRATHRVLDRDYAIKVLFGEVASNQVLTERFRREAHAVSKMNHPNVVSVLDFGSTRQGLHFMAMELVSGRTLRWVIRKLGPLQPWRAASIARQMADGLQEAHRLGFLHRDLKPSNVMVFREDGREHIKILDFGLVREASPDRDEPWLTKTGQFVGTPTYMAPEQITGERADALVDLYSLGVILYEMLEGRPPFEAKRVVEMQQKHLTQPPPPPRPAQGLEKLVLHLLEKEPAKRPQTARDVVVAIDRLGIREPAREPSPALPDLEASPQRREEEEEAQDHFDLGLALRQLERFDDAIRKFEAASEVPSLAVAALEQIGHCHVDRGDPRAAIQHFESALEAGATGGAATNLKFELGVACERCGDRAGMLRWFRAAHADDPNHRSVGRRLAALGVRPEADEADDAATQVALEAEAVLPPARAEKIAIPEESTSLGETNDAEERTDRVAPAPIEWIERDSSVTAPSAPMNPVAFSGTIGPAAPERALATPAVRLDPAVERNDVAPPSGNEPSSRSEAVSILDPRFDDDDAERKKRKTVDPGPVFLAVFVVGVVIIIISMLMRVAHGSPLGIEIERRAMEATSGDHAAENSCR